MHMKALPISRYVYGTTRLGDEGISFEDRVAIAREAMDRGLDLHTSHQYGNALEVIRTASDQSPHNPPRYIVKIGWSSPEEIRDQLMMHTHALSVHKMAVGQLCLGKPLADEIATGGPGIDALLALKHEGLVESFVLENWPWSPPAYLQALKNGQAAELVDAFIFYLNPLQRFVLNDVWTELQDQGFPIVAMRTVAGGPSPKSGYLKDRWEQMLPIYQDSGCSTWTEFCARFAFGHPNVAATVGSTACKEHLEALIRETASPAPLPTPVMESIWDLQGRWSQEHDRFAEPWSM